MSLKLREEWVTVAQFGIAQEVREVERAFQSCLRGDL